VCSLRDIGRLKQIESELREALAKEKELSALKSSFTSLVSHEFRTPLAVIQFSADILLNYADRMDQARRLEKLLFVACPSGDDERYRRPLNHGLKLPRTGIRRPRRDHREEDRIRP
jgi:signal transduction histidine kinase